MDTATTAKCPFSDSLSFPFNAIAAIPSTRRRNSAFSAASGRCPGSRCGMAARFGWSLAITDAQQVLGDVRFSSVPSQPGYPLISPAVVAAKRGDPSFLRMDPPKHTEHRRMWTPFFAIKRIQEMRPRIQRIIDTAIDEMLAKTAPGDLVQDFALVVPSLVICELLDVPYSEHEFFQRHSKTIFAIDATAEQVADARAAIATFWQQMIDAREKNPGDDLVSQVIVNEVGGGRLSKRESVAMVSLMLAAGHETTANMIALGVVTLLQHPDQLNAIKADPTLTRPPSRNSCDTSRWRRTAWDEPRRRTSKSAASSSARARACCASAAANRDEPYSKTPMRLISGVSRIAIRHSGRSIHQCIGSPLARAELQMAFDTLFKRVPNLQLAVAPEDIKYKFDSLFFGVHSLPVSW